jgi:hypothetical protein
MSGGGTDNDEDFCGNGCGRRLTAQEKKIGVCSRCQRQDLGDVQGVTIFMPTSTLTFMPTSQMAVPVITSIAPFAPMMSRKLCPDKNCNGVQVKDSSKRGWHCSNARCQYHTSR